ncbi:MAG: hypothetical protein JRJ57_01430 [Deltaproteobacteria bacterium]|nr:hypothetical protein [Deltaproteobacteria bacterium]
MERSIVTVAEGKKSFSRLINNAQPVVVMVPYDEYRHSKRIDGYRKIMQARAVFLKADISADEIYKESKKQLEEKD